MIISRFGFFNLLRALLASDFVFYDDIILDGMFTEHAQFLTQGDPGKRIFFFTENKKGIKQFLMRLGLRHSDQMNNDTFLISYAFKSKIFISDGYLVNIAIVENLEEAKEAQILYAKEKLKLDMRYEKSIHNPPKIKSL